MLTELLSGGMPGTDGRVSDSGWSNTELFLRYMQEHFIKYVPSCNADNPILRTGIHPFNPQAFDKSVLRPSEVLQQLTTEPEPILLTLNNSVPGMSDDNPENTVVHTLAEGDHVANQEDENDNPLQDLKTFFTKRVSKVPTKKPSKPKKTLSKITSGKAVTEDETFNKITECVQQRQLKEKSVKSSKKATKRKENPVTEKPIKPKKSKLKKKIDSQILSTSGIISGVHGPLIVEDSCELTDSDDDRDNMPSFAKSSLEDRMYDLNTRFLSILINKVVKDDAKIWSKLEAERRSYSEAIESLKTEYYEKIQTVDRLQSEVITLETQTLRLKESVKDFKTKYQHMLDNYMKQSETTNELELKLRNTEQTLEQKTQEYVEVEEKNTALKEKYYRQEITTKITEKRMETCERKLKLFESVRVQPESAEEFIEVSLRDISRLIYNMQSTFWTKVQNYFSKLEAEFKTEVTKVKKNEYSKYGKLVMEQKEEFERQISNVYKEKQEDSKTISKLREERNMLQEKLAINKVQIEEYKSTIEVTSTQTTTYDIVLNVRREEDEGMREQVNFYEVLTEVAEEEESKMTVEKMKMRWEDLKTRFSQDPPEFIRRRLESARTLLDNPHDTKTGQEADLESSQVQEISDQQLKMEGKKLE
ncbi:EEA1 [Mytilus coruscus]|uniref:EEA1 n=1 Tax=Mytilus coruscus TaxID=42192 RepID=A0A6J8DIL1_MYTCO|nr:EEA1 [Mytilus coruscus]